MISDFFSQSEEEFNLEFAITGTGSSHFCFYKNELEISEFVKKFQIIGDSLMLNHYNTHLLMIINGVWPSGKATGFDPVMRRFESYHPSQLKCLVNLV